MKKKEKKRPGIEIKESTPAPSKSRSSSPVKSGVEEIKSSQPVPVELTEKAKKVTDAIIKGTSKIKKSQRQSLTAQPKESTKNDDDKTVIVDTNPTIEKYGTNIKSFKSLIEKYKDLPGNNSIDDFENEDAIKMKGFIKALGIAGKTKKLETLRKKASIL